MIRSTGALLLFAALSAGQAMASDVTFKGNLLDRPCHVSSGNPNRHVVFKIRAPRDFWYPPGRSPAKPFVVRLGSCHAATVGRAVTLAFKGTEEAALPGHLKVAGANAGRLDITPLDTDGSSLLKPGASHNKGQERKVAGNSLELPFGTYVVATPEALRTKSVIPGDYETTVTFELTYRWQNFCTGYFK